MVKLQQVIRHNGSKVHSVNIPLEKMEEVGWKKGDELKIEKKLLESGGYGLLIINKDA